MVPDGFSPELEDDEELELLDEDEEEEPLAPEDEELDELEDELEEPESWTTALVLVTEPAELEMTTT